jgi:hypothetical protein
MQVLSWDARFFSSFCSTSFAGLCSLSSHDYMVATILVTISSRHKLMPSLFFFIRMRKYFQKFPSTSPSVSWPKPGHMLHTNPQQGEWDYKDELRLFHIYPWIMGERLPGTQNQYLPRSRSLFKLVRFVRDKLSKILSFIVFYFHSTQIAWFYVFPCCLFTMTLNLTSLAHNYSLIFRLKIQLLQTLQTQYKKDVTTYLFSSMWSASNIFITTNEFTIQATKFTIILIYLLFLMYSHESCWFYFLSVFISLHLLYMTQISPYFFNLCCL